MSRVIQRWLDVGSPLSLPRTLTFVPAFQKSFGRHMSWDWSSHPHDPSCLGETSISIAFWILARMPASMTSLRNLMMTGIPTPTVASL